MTIEEATKYAGWIQQAFPHMKMEARLYVRALVHYDAQVAQTAILDAITHEWQMLPKVAEVVAVVKSSTPSSRTDCPTCSGDRMVHVGISKAGMDEYAPCPDCNPVSGTDYFMGGHNMSVRSYSTKDHPLHALDPARVRAMMDS